MNTAVRLIVAALTSIIFAGTLAAQDYPTRPVRLVATGSPGGGTDVFARVFADVLQQELGTGVIVENQGGTSAMRTVESATPNGYTLLFSDSSFTILPSLRKNLGYDPLKSFVPIAKMGEVDIMFCVHPSIPVKTLAELIRYTKANPGKIRFGHGGDGTFPHVAGELFKSVTGAEIEGVPYRGGGRAVTAALAGEVEMVVSAVPAAADWAKQGKLQAIAVTSQHRLLALAPDVPTMAESGFPNGTVSSYFVVMGPANLPPPIQQRLIQAAGRVMATDKFRERALTIGSETKELVSGAALASYLAADVKRWQEVVAKSGITVE
jgi:tripartite-type tricarboxylate transporter receptor subunit TctC